MVPLLFGSPIKSHGSVSFATGGSHEWIVPAGVFHVAIEMWGRGGNSGTSSGFGMGGGGGGAYAKRNASEVIPGETLTVYVGDQTNGETSVRNELAVLLGRAAAGTNATTTAGQPGGTTANSDGDIEFAGGTGRAGASGAFGGGGGGGGGGRTANGGNGSLGSGSNGGAGGAGGVTGGGAGGAGGGGGQAGSNGTAPGGGAGGGGGTTGAGATGGLGLVIIHW